MKKGKLWYLLDYNKAAKEGPLGIKKRQEERLEAIVSYARENSKYYQKLYKNLPSKVTDINLLPPTNKNELMSHFNEWVTDPLIDIESLNAFINNPDTVGNLYLDRYTVATTSGTTGKHGIFLIDNDALTVNLALSFRGRSSWIAPKNILKIFRKRGRTAVIVATGGHFLVSSGASRMRKDSVIFKSTFKFFSVHMSIPELVQELNSFDPAFVIGYGSVISLLANEQASGRLNIHPAIIEPAGETLLEEDRDKLGRIFNAKIHSSYGSTECPFLSTICEYGWYHVNTDWTYLEPVDKNYMPVKPGEMSHTVLISNLANKVQPILRYDLGDRVVMRADQCPCGNPHPAIRVQGRAADILTFQSESGKSVSMVPLAFVTEIDKIKGINQFQIVQTEPTTLRIRLLVSVEDSDAIWGQVVCKVTELLKRNNLCNIKIEHGTEPPELTKGGKLRTVIPLQIKK